MDRYETITFERELRIARAHLGASTDEVRMVRALVDVHAVESTNLEVAFGAAVRLYDNGLVHPGQVRRLYGNGGSTYDLVNDAVAAKA